MDEAFYQDPEHRPKPTVGEAGEIPLIDLSPLAAESAEARQALPGLLDQVEAACMDWGFLQVVNHGVPLELLEGLQLAAREFFALPAEEKAQVRRDAVNPWGTTKGSTRRTSGTGKRFWTSWCPARRRDAGQRYGRAVEELAFKLLELISLTLGLPAKRLNEFFEGGSPSTFIRLNYYPPCPAPHLALGVGRHKDAGALTVLAQDDVGGLDVKRRSDGEWVRVKPIPGSLIINVGDIIQVWSNDKYESAEHRVSVNSERERFSIPFFFNPDMSTMIEALEELVSDGAPRKYEAYNWGMFFKTRKDSNFGKLAAENIQIHHFKKNTQ
ncbi:unnamed protein product [Spirodela intermedia]|uniref:Fe2OG dioxygenase domain-containing protein n=1 Tax=Spirodela intermedia TaxID=51605 RepID=A0A7I8IJ43_SPIIN|nr:unnamed protein product [Spirodela intermedia]CAA6657760.1 unnamed protein product [Spirodela intermedia]